MKKLLLFLFILCALANVKAQSINEWLNLTPVELEKPALSQVKNVRNKIFENNMFPEYSSLTIENLIPEENAPAQKNLVWSKAQMNGDTIIAIEKDSNFMLNHYAVYLHNTDWMKGSLNFKIFGNADIYIDGVKKMTVNGTKPTDRRIDNEWLPGKHCIIVKVVSQGGKVLTANFKADKKFENIPVTFSLSPKRAKNIYDVHNGRNVNNLSISPSGKYAVVGMTNTVGGKSNYTSFLYRIKDKEIVFSTNGMTQVKWTPDKDQLSYLQKEGDAMSLYIYDVETRKQTCLIKEDRKIKNYTWAPDMSYIIYTDNENYTDAKWELKKLEGIQDRQAYFRSRSFLCKYDFATGLHSRLTWGNLSTLLLDISHDSKKILFSTSHPDYEEYPFSKQDVYLMDIETLHVDTLWKDRIYGIICQFSPDSKKLVITGGPSSFGKTGQNIGKNPIANEYDRQAFIYDLDSKNVEPITLNFNPSIESITWHKDGNLYLKVTEADYVRLYRYTDGKFERIECPGDLILHMSIAANAPQMIYLASTTRNPAKVYSLNLKTDEAELWDDPQEEQYRNIVLGEVKDWDFNYKKGTIIEGRYYLPADFDPNKKYPMIVYYYGGTTPSARRFGGSWPYHLYCANGYVVYIPQPSGAIGYGQEFSARHQNNWGKITADEIIEATKAFTKAHPFIDASKVGCIGASYGGFTTQLLTTKTDIFACAISHAGISSISSYWGEGYWGYGYNTNAAAYSYPWNRKDIYVDQSPLFNADKVKVPLLLIHGTKDVNVPPGESIQFYTALKLLGKDVDLVLVKDADHGVVEYNQRILWTNTILSYFAKYLKDKPEWWENMYKDLNL